MGEKNTDRADILDQVKSELGKFGEDIAARMEADAEKVKQLDAEIATLKAGTGEKFKRSWFGSLAAGQPMVAPAGLSVDEVIEHGRAAAGVQYVRMGDQMVPLMTSAPPSAAGLAGHRRALVACRVIRAASVASGMGKAGDYDAMIGVAAGQWGDTEVAGYLEETRDLVHAMSGADRDAKAQAQRVLGTHTLGSGAALVAPELASGIIDFLHPLAVVRSLGAGTLPLTSGTLSMPYMNSAVTASYVGENTGVNESSPADARLNFVRKTLQAIVAMSKELLAESSYAVDVFLLQHLGAAMAGAEDLKFIRGDGTQDTPRGLKYWAELSTGGGGAHKFDRTLSGGAPTVQTITDDAMKAMRLVEDSKVPMVNTGWIMPVRTAYGLMAKRNAATAIEVFPELRAGNFYGSPFRKTPQIPKTNAGDAAGSGTNNKTEVYFAAFASCTIAEAQGLEINSFPGGAYKDASGNVVSGITNREVVIEACANHDFGCLYRGDEVTVIDSVDWGAPN